MGKKSVGSFVEPAFEDVTVPAEARAGRLVHRVKDLLTQMLKQTQQKHKLHMLVHHY